MSIDNIRLVRDSVAQHGPEHFDMMAWFMVPDTEVEGYTEFTIGERYERGARALDKPVDINQCGTTACIAGHAVLAGRLNETLSDEVDHHDVARWLGMDPIFNWLFDVDQWPGWAQDLYNNDDGWKAALTLLDAIIAYGRIPTIADHLPDPAHA